MNHVYSKLGLKPIGRKNKVVKDGRCLAQKGKTWRQVANFNYKSVENIEVQNYRVLLGRPIEGVMSAILEVSKGLTERFVSKLVVDEPNYKYLQEHFFNENRNNSLLDQLINEGVDIIPIQELLNYIELNYDSIDIFLKAFNEVDQKINPELLYSFAPQEKLLESVIKLIIPSYAYDHDTNDCLKSVTVTDISFLSPLKFTGKTNVQDGIPRGLLAYDTLYRSSKSNNFLARQEQAIYFMDSELGARLLNGKCTHENVKIVKKMLKNEAVFSAPPDCSNVLYHRDGSLKQRWRHRFDFEHMFAINSVESARDLANITQSTLRKFYFDDLHKMHISKMHIKSKRLSGSTMPLDDEYKISLENLFSSQLNFNVPCVPYPDGTEGCYLDTLSSMYLGKLRNRINTFFFLHMSELAKQSGVESIFEQSLTELKLMNNDFKGATCFNSDSTCKLIRLFGQGAFMSLDETRLVNFTTHAFLNASTDMGGQYVFPTNFDLYMSALYKNKNEHKFPCIAALNLSHFDVISLNSFAKNKALYKDITVTDALSYCTLPWDIGYEQFISGLSLSVAEGILEGGCSYFDLGYLVRNPVSRGAIGWYMAGGPAGCCLGVAGWVMSELPEFLRRRARPGSFMRGCALIVDTIGVSLPLLMPNSLYKYAGGIIGFGLGKFGITTLLSTFYPVCKKKAATKNERLRAQKQHRKKHRNECGKSDRTVETTSLWSTLTRRIPFNRTRVVSNIKEEQKISLVESDPARLNRLLSGKKNSDKDNISSDAEIVCLLEKMDKEGSHPIESLPKGVISDLVSWLPGSSVAILDKAISANLDNLTEKDSKARFIANQVKRYENYIKGGSVPGKVTLSHEELKKAINQFPGLYLNYLKYPVLSGQSRAADLWQALEPDSHKGLLMQTALILAKSHIQIHNKTATKEILGDKKMEYDLRLKLIENLSSQEHEKLVEWGLTKTLVDAYIVRVLSTTEKQTTDIHRLKTIKELNIKFQKKPALTDNLIHLLNKFQLTENYAQEDRKTVMSFYVQLRLQANHERVKKGQHILKCLRAEAILHLLHNKLPET